MKKPWIALGLTLMLTAACYGDPTGYVPLDPIVSRITFDFDSVTVGVGKEVSVTATAIDYRGQSLGTQPGGVAMQWTTQDFRIATVADGLIRGVKAGKVIVTVRAGAVLGALRVTVE